MKLKLIISVPLLAAVVVAGWWLFQSHKRVDTKIVPEKVSNVATADVSVSPSPVRLHSLKIVTQSSTNLYPSIEHGGNWSLINSIIDDNGTYQQRLADMDGLSGPLSDNDWALLKKYLLTPSELDQIQQNQILKNRLLDVLCAMDPPPSELGDALAQMYQNTKQTEVLRDYAVQHMSVYYEQVSKTTKAAAIADVLWQATSETDNTIGGTALLALQRLSDEYTNFDKGRIASTALQMARNFASNEPAKITAYQVCAQLDVADALPLVLAAANGGQTIPIRMSAIAALGRLGGSEQIPFLNNVLAGDENRLKPAAQVALEKITSRIQAANQR